MAARGEVVEEGAKRHAFVAITLGERALLGS